MGLDQTDPTFVSDLRKSQEAVLLAAAYLTKRGYTVALPSMLIRPSAEERDGFQDDGDLFIQMRAEVKHRNLAFSGASDYPYETVIIDRKPKFDRAVPAPFWYFILNAEKSCMILIRVRETKDQWVVTKRRDGHTKRVEEYYECPIEWAVFVPLDA